MVLNKLRNAGLQVDIKKCKFSIISTKFLGFIIATDGIKPNPLKIIIVRDWQSFTSVKEV